ncbi:hypothetical protein OPV22_001233 [Ensete ventricosum]|uniref:Secreted protein n=1 Tax=Ensete ventricosum TaxID=4639 RepID=A0AAV8RKV3_ENSVE|nr:hypothetical protein OPV22_001233 [Ensete ventricosum]
MLLSKMFAANRRIMGDLVFLTLAMTLKNGGSLRLNPPRLLSTKDGIHRYPRCAFPGGAESPVTSYGRSGTHDTWRFLWRAFSAA